MMRDRMKLAIEKILPANIYSGIRPYTDAQKARLELAGTFADAVLDTLREPTEAMLKAADKADDIAGIEDAMHRRKPAAFYFAQAWQAMIDEAKK